MLPNEKMDSQRTRDSAVAALAAATAVKTRRWLKKMLQKMLRQTKETNCTEDIALESDRVDWKQCMISW